MAINIYKIFSGLCIFGGMILSSGCVDDKIITDSDPSDSDGNPGEVITLTMTLDVMGGSRAAENDPVAIELETIENFIDPEKTRVIFFDDDDKFLFESKSRWLKQLDASTDHIVWSVYVPLYTYGNDKEKEYNWNWEGIRTKLTSGSFKIAILANRPAYQYYPDLNDADFGDYWYDNSGPKWTYKNSSVYEGSDGEIKDIFDLHHTQFDPIYWNKSIEGNGGGNAYDFIMGGTFAKEQATLSATASWLDYEDGDTRRDPYGWDFRYNRIPTKDDPIPMYGVQQFEALSDWDPGTTVDLSRVTDRPISLLRSAVKIDLMLPEGFADDVVMFYGNWFSRCEPMDVWTPTDLLWNPDHGKASDWRDDPYCEMYKIWNRKPIAYSDRATDGTAYEYKKIIMWQYGIWKLKKDWKFSTTASPTLDTDFAREYGSLTEDDFPHIFNTCIQRIQRVNIRKTYTYGGYDHYVVYCGERNVNDPTNLTNLPNTGSGNSPVLYWSVIKGTITDLNPSLAADKAIIDGNPGIEVNKKYTSATTYSFPMVDFSHGASVFNCTRVGVLSNQTPNGKSYTAYMPYNGYNINDSNGMGEYARRIAGNNTSNSTSFRPGDNGSLYPLIDRPLPLIRNHVYKMTVGNPVTRGDGSVMFNITSEVKASPTISFKK